MRPCPIGKNAACMALVASYRVKKPLVATSLVNSKSLLLLAMLNSSTFVRLGRTEFLGVGRFVFLDSVGLFVR